MRPATVDAVIIDGSRVLLVKRRFEPFKGRWALPGGFVDDNETVEQAVGREALEETSLKVKVKKIIGVYSDPRRDRRGNITVAFLVKFVGGKLGKGDEAKEVKWFKLDELPPLAFDHAKIIKDARRML
ncbi:MAG: ADP-ribose pyrophosphatase [Candidatus Fermentimicrarchaeum limneticum]|uniref:ADP-ribose pyrophosphatase n=1 Tax=Fermentimicrarchaeum limneticum TaxID=2795018 RepID=A0A7D5XKJ7_FERL1|nr:MAG: ADP-ribose pyrophosphatase [Candidatus Fermentimicrarchaeum limneticum]